MNAFGVKDSLGVLILFATDYSLLEDQLEIAEMDDRHTF